MKWKFYHSSQSKLLIFSDMVWGKWFIIWNTTDINILSIGRMSSSWTIRFCILCVTCFTYVVLIRLEWICINRNFVLFVCQLYGFSLYVGAVSGSVLTQIWTRSRYRHYLTFNQNKACGVT